MTGTPIHRHSVGDTSSTNQHAYAGGDWLFQYDRDKDGGLVWTEFLSVIRVLVQGQTQTASIQADSHVEDHSGGQQDTVLPQRAEEP
jgi:hypothetical protein